jgi:N6-L-threonylcarbamoyladenine synthase
MLILGVETSCDETSAAVINERQTLSNVISSQEVHTRFGGVVPELASRAHVRLIAPIVRQALQDASAQMSDLDGIAVTCGPGLVGALLVGVNFVKGLAMALNRPFIGVNHLEGHVYGNLLTQDSFSFPALFLIVSGGHTLLALMLDHLKYQIIGRTRDDAVGEAFDKGAKLLGLGYPGGPLIDKLAREGDASFIRFPRALNKSGDFDFSYSGLKTALLTYIKNTDPALLAGQMNDICASYQSAAIEILVQKTMTAAHKFNARTIGIAGGVAANSLLREKLAEAAHEKNYRLLLPELRFCTDNAAMIARVGMEYLNKGYKSGSHLNAYPALKLGQIKDCFAVCPIKYS